MIKKIAWNTFKNTGDVNTFLELKQIQNIEQELQTQGQQDTIRRIGTQMQQNDSNEIMGQMQQQTEAQNGNNQNEWYNNF